MKTGPDRATRAERSLTHFQFGKEFRLIRLRQARGIGTHPTSFSSCSTARAAAALIFATTFSS